MTAPLTIAYIALGAAQVLRETPADGRRARLFTLLGGELDVIDYILTHAATVDTIDAEGVHAYEVASTYGENAARALLDDPNADLEDVVDRLRPEQM